MRERYSIFASVGNSKQPFDRLLRMVDEAAARLGRATLLQAGTSSYQPHYADRVDYVGREEFDDLCRAADHLVVHGGAGSVMAAMRYGKVPIVVPRRGDLGEHINNHQLELAAELPALGWCRTVENVDDLIRLLQTPCSAAPEAHLASNQLMRELVTDFILTPDS